ncbi:HNH endonuclease [Planococcus maitriensis]|uniref:HNH nuclease domain-containing protein n=1 Tax=Planococcus maitriensis TaxID=221799 RepID=A0A365K525_9BACL|nr:HNH endonuclease [Planococcus maitriensis]RAZ67272.1 hypothetical protein DP119_10935 [Planococcus maitriensis]
MLKMLVQIKDRLRYTKAHKKTLRKLRPFPGGTWDKKSPQIKDLKSHIKKILLFNQGEKCAYCSQPFNITSGAEIEHIAPKGGAVYPRHTEFTFTAHNLVLACHLCNSPVKKGRKDTIISKNINYRNCTFNIVHPYFDNVYDHYKLTLDDTLSGIIYKPITNKAKNTIDIFDLNNEAHVTARGEQSVAKQLKTHDVSKSRELLLAAIQDYK